MSTIIKAADGQAGIHGVAFNFEDLARHGDTYLAAIREQAAQLLKQAVDEANSIRRAAEAQGKQAAEQAADRQLDQRVHLRLETVLPALRTATEEIQAQRQGWMAHWEQRVVHLAAAIAARLIRRELTLHPEITLDLIREALDLAAGSPQVRVVLNPEDYAALQGQVDSLVAEFSHLAPASLAIDPRISAGGCRVETTYGSIDQQFESQLARVEEELA
jgi:flagellar assembly protein FliH